LCAHLDGLPLALELAAARLTVLSPALLLRRLTPRLPTLAGNARDLPERQRTLRATLDWSHALLGAGEQAMFRRLAVFAGGCTLPAVDAVCTAGEGLDAPAVAGDAVERLGALLDQSLLRREDGAGGEPRFAMLEIVREYAAEHLAASGEEAGIRRAHAAHYLALAEGAEPELSGPGQLAWLGRLEDEHDNVRAALAFAQDSGDAATVLRLAGALWRFWSVRGYVSEGRRWLREAVALTTAGGEGVAARTTALRGAALLALQAGALDEAAAAGVECLALARPHGGQIDLVDALNARGLIARQGGDYATATMCLEEALAIAPASGYRAGEAAALAELGLVTFFGGDTPRALALLERGRTLYRALGDTRALAGVLRDLGWLAWHAGDAARGEALREEALGLFRALGDTGQVAETLWTLGIGAQSRGDLARATALHEESLALRRARPRARGAGPLDAGAGRAPPARCAGRPGDADGGAGDAAAARRALGRGDGARPAGTRRVGRGRSGARAVVSRGGCRALRGPRQPPLPALVSRRPRRRGGGAGSSRRRRAPVRRPPGPAGAPRPGAVPGGPRRLRAHSGGGARRPRRCRLRRRL
ncbi:MAG: tetratricopeptide repeat protein, partial [Chloroflexota bacterium]|nr:tetratricopeptide repeat protein [Chloroflexota bacterium]